jgi:hypothetical protein
MQIEEVITDPATYGKSITLHLNASCFSDTDLLEYVCAENERDGSGRHVAGKASDEQTAPVKVAPEVPAEYVGTYDIRAPESPNVKPDAGQSACPNAGCKLIAKHDFPR